MNITIEHGPISILKPEGDLDGNSFGQLLASGDGLLEDHHKLLVVDLGSVSYVSSAGLLALLTIANRAANLGGKVVLAGPQPAVLKLLTLTAFEQVIGIYPDCPSAQAALAGAATSPPA